ncbi:MAG: hypothetical protein KF723_03275 [Rhizobiaceae bacterium]|nr:hypothetical protein [Rhizobiaceae bacterium]
MVKDSGYNVGMQATGVGLAVGALLWTGHAKAVEAVRADREAREQAAYDAAVAYRLGNAAEVEALALELADELAEAKAEIVRLRRQLGQKQAYIDSLRRPS